MIRQWFNYLWIILFNLFSKNEAIETSGRTNKKQEEESEQAESEAISNHIYQVSSGYIKEDKMEIVPVEERMNQVAEAAPSEIGRVVESEIDTNEETTTSEVTHDSDTLKHKEQTEEYEAKGTAKIVGTQGKTTSAAEAKSKQSESVTVADEGDRKVLTTKTSSSKSYSFEETTEYED